MPNLTGLFAYALTADISREVNDYMRMLRAIRDWSHEAAHPEDLEFASIERRVKKSRDSRRMPRAILSGMRASVESRRRC